MNTENNKLIAEFLGDKIEQRDYGSALPGRKAFYYVCKNNTLVFLCMDNGTDNALHEVWMREAAKLTFHKDWNALMEVVEKIFSMSVPNKEGGEYDTENFFRTFGMQNDQGQYMVRLNALSLFESDILIEVVYNSVVEFITWYNKQQPQK